VTTSPPGPGWGRATLWKAPLDRGRWTDWVIHTRWSYTADGLLEVWKNGQLVVAKQGPNTYNDSHSLYFMVGIYKWPWMETGLGWTQTKRVLYVDEIRMVAGPGSYDLVAP
jgi:hypothetical protein